MKEMIYAWFDAAPMWMQVLIFTLLIILLAALIVGGVALLVHVFGLDHVPTVHLNGECQQFYDGTTIKGITTYQPVQVCP